jgi:hypothetical protein
MRTTLVALLALLLAGLSPAADPPATGTWAKQKAMARRPGLTLTTDGPGGKPAARPVTQIVFTVLADEGGRIRVHYPGQQGWADKADWVRLADALDHFTARTQADPADAFAWSRRGSPTGTPGSRTSH